VKTFALLILLVVVGCSRSSDRTTPGSSTAPSSTTATLSPSLHTDLTLTASGEPFGLRVEGAAISFCDKRGGRKLDTTTGQDAAFERKCATDGEANTACGGLPLDVSVSTPNRGPNDLVDVKGKSFPLEGRVHDCAADAKVLAIVTGSAVVLVDTTKDKADVIDHQGGDRVAVGPGWVAWSQGSTVRARKR
jgi:hypothetical protein